MELPHTPRFRARPVAPAPGRPAPLVPLRPPSSEPFHSPLLSPISPSPSAFPGPADVAVAPFAPAPLVQRAAFITAGVAGLLQRGAAHELDAQAEEAAGVPTRAVAAYSAAGDAFAAAALAISSGPDVTYRERKREREQLEAAADRVNARADMLRIRLQMAAAEEARKSELTLKTPASPVGAQLEDGAGVGRQCTVCRTEKVGLVAPCGHVFCDEHGRLCANIGMCLHPDCAQRLTGADMRCVST